MKDLTSEGTGKSLQMFVSHNELRMTPQVVRIDMDEATGRVIVRGSRVPNTRLGLESLLEI